MTINNSDKLYLNLDVFEWPFFVESCTRKENSKIWRSYERLEYARSLSEGTISEFKLSDSVANLKRAVDVRLKLLDELYHFSSASALKKLGALERLEAVGIAKPFLIKQLFELRNDIEHNDIPGPSLDRVRELLDITWYFLRSTDSIVSESSRRLLFEDPVDDCDETKCWLSLHEFSGKSNEIYFHAWLSPRDLSNKSGWEISVESIRAPSTASFRREATTDLTENVRNPDQRHVTGSISASGNSLVVLWKRMFLLQ